MSQAISYFWEIGSNYLVLLGNLSFNGVPILCYILGTFLVSIVINNLVNVAKSTRLKKSYSHESTQGVIETYYTNGNYQINRYRRG